MCRLASDSLALQEDQEVWQQDDQWVELDYFIYFNLDSDLANSSLDAAPFSMIQVLLATYIAGFWFMKALQLLKPNTIISWFQ